MSLVNENKLFSVIGRYFRSDRTLVNEMIQNAQRAGATTIDIIADLKGYDIEFRDDGHGIRDLKSLIGIAFSGWGEDVDPQDPAGMGFLQLISQSSHVEIQSKGFCNDSGLVGRIEIDCEKFLHSMEYREGLFNSCIVDDNVDMHGYSTIIKARMKKVCKDYFAYNYDYFPYACAYIDVIINGVKTQKKHIDDYIAEAKRNVVPVYAPIIEFTYLGNRGVILFGEYSHKESIVNWYGTKIDSYSANTIAGCYFEVREGTPLTPIYPDRNSIMADDRLSEFNKFLSDTIKSKALQIADDLDNNPYNPDLQKYAIQFLKFMYKSKLVDKDEFLSGYKYICGVEIKEQGGFKTLFRGIYGTSIDSGNTCILNKQEMSNAIALCSPLYDVEGYASMLKTASLNDVLVISLDSEKHAMYCGIPYIDNIETDFIGISEAEVEADIILSDQCVKSVVCNELFILDPGNITLRAPSIEAMRDIIYYYFEDLFNHDWDLDMYDETQYAHEVIDEYVRDNCKIIKLEVLSALPNTRNITRIDIGDDSLTITYKDGTSAIYKLERGLYG